MLGIKSNYVSKRVSSNRWNILSWTLPYLHILKYSRHIPLKKNDGVWKFYKHFESLYFDSGHPKVQCTIYPISSKFHIVQGRANICIVIWLTVYVPENHVKEKEKVSNIRMLWSFLFWKLFCVLVINFLAPRGLLLTIAWSLCDLVIWRRDTRTRFPHSNFFESIGDYKNVPNRENDYPAEHV